MKQITDVIKKKEGINIIFDGEHSVHVEPEMVIKYKLLSINVLDNETFLTFFNENERLRALRFCFKKLKKLLTVLEMKTLLSEENFDKKIIDETLHYLIQKHYLDDLAYAKYYVNMKSNQQGPLLITHKLSDKGISLHIIEKVMMNYDQNRFIEDIIEKKLKQSQKKTKKQALESIKRDLLAKGFQHDYIDISLQKLHHLYQGNEDNLLSTYAQKYYDTLSQRYQGYTLMNKLKEKLYQKGFSYDQIKAYLQSKDF